MKVGASGIALEYATMNVNRPFLFLIREAGFGQILFMGVVENPNDH